ncbi:MAG: SAM-dependent methyltransferase [Thermomicrobiales bacterium]
MTNMHLASDSQTSKSPDYFEEIYKEGPDPWGFEQDDYELDKYRATIRALSRERYHSAFEIGCSVGVLTEQLAARCDLLLAVDIVEAPLERARERCRDLSGVRFARMQVPHEFPEETFDLIVLSEVAYYWSSADVELAVDLSIQRLNLRGQLLLVHWRPEIEGCALTGDDVHQIAGSRCAGSLRHQLVMLNEHYRLDLYERQRR